MKRLIANMFDRAGYKLLRRESFLDLLEFKALVDVRQVADVWTRLSNLKALGFAPEVIFDCGAFVGDWSRNASTLFSNAFFILIEPNREIIDRTLATARDISSTRVIVENVALGAKRGTGHLQVWEDLHHATADKALMASSLLTQYDTASSREIQVEIRTLDELYAKHKLFPNLVKLDLQGYEIPALQGAKSLLGQTEIFIIEFGLQSAYESRSDIRDLLDLMYDHGYKLYDVVDLFYRPYDGALSGGDMFFVHETSPCYEQSQRFS